ncbi:MAG: thiamine pyrophosphate-dependent dehydrogenase E1 component subunit alpha [Deltaproteobacteria bacterium]|nr:thiamine pyrophosphate-dependent dehydrogenase E1 component subunit alpha [Deltaproteobacteria bacterium]
MEKDILIKEEALVLYRKLTLARLAEEKIREEYFKDEMKTPVHLGIGGEAIPVGVCHCLPKGTKTFGTYRNHSLYLTMTEDTDAFFGEMYGKASGVAKGKAGSMHLSAPELGFLATSAVVGTTIPLAVGAALANQYRKSNEMVTVFFGDGAVEEGVFWESLNFASLKKLPILFVCEDNGLAIHTPSEQRQGFRSIQKITEVFDCHWDSGDGSNVQEVIQKSRRAVRQMRTNPKPGFLHFTYYRFLEHVGPREDFDAGYRSRPTEAERNQRDPLLQFEKTLCQNGCTPKELEVVQKINRDKIDQSVKKAQQSPFPRPEELYTDIFS